MKAKEIPLSLYHSVRLRHGHHSVDDQTKVAVVVSLTSIPSRLATLDIVIASLLVQKTQPKTIVLWLNHSLKGKTPLRLERLQNSIFKIRYCNGTSSFRKLLPTLEAYKDTIIVTCDDDMIYPSNWLQNLYSGHLKHKNSVISQVGRLIQWSEDGTLKNYKAWPFVRYECSEKNFLPIGYGGVLYPVSTFDKRVFDENVFMKLTPKADDLWFKAMAYLNGKSTYCASEKAKPIPIINSQTVALNHQNINADKNKHQWQSLCEYFTELSELGL